MNHTLRKDAETIIRQAISAVTPAYAVEKALKGRSFPGRVWNIRFQKSPAMRAVIPFRMNRVCPEPRLPWI